MDEKMYTTGKRIDGDPLLQPENWLNRVRQEKEAEKMLLKEVETHFGKELDATARYMAAVENQKRITAEDPWAEH